MTSVKYIKGILTPTNSDAVNENTRDKILDASLIFQLGLTIKSENNDGVITLNGTSVAFGGRKSALEFIDRLTSILHEEGIAELAHTGSLMLTIVSDKEPMAFRITVEKGNVSYEEADLAWKEKVDNPYLPYPYSKAKPLWGSSSK